MGWGEPHRPIKPIKNMGRDELTTEFYAFLAEARRRGDDSNGASLIAQWYAFRAARDREQSLHGPVA